MYGYESTRNLLGVLKPSHLRMLRPIERKTAEEVVRQLLNIYCYLIQQGADCSRNLAQIKFSE